MFSEIAAIVLVAARLGQFLQFLKVPVILILNFTRPMRLPILINTNSDILYDIPLNYAGGGQHFVSVQMMTSLGVDVSSAFLY